MSHQSQLDFVAEIKSVLPLYFERSKVLEVGSLNINGSVRKFFDSPSKYIGCDLGEGDGVDIVCRGHELPYEDNSFDVVISCECFEHDQYWQQTFQKMINLARIGGLVLFSCATIGRPEHGTTKTSPKDAPFTNDYYQNLSENDFQCFKSQFRIHAFSECASPRDLYFWGLK